MNFGVALEMSNGTYLHHTIESHSYQVTNGISRTELPVMMMFHIFGY